MVRLLEWGWTESVTTIIVPKTPFLAQNKKPKPKPRIYHPTLQTQKKPSGMNRPTPDKPHVVAEPC